MVTGKDDPPVEQIDDYRLGRESRGWVASSKLIWFPGGKEYIATLLEQRGASTTMSRVQIKNEDGPGRDWSGEELDERAAGMNRIAKPWIAIATSGSDAFSMHSGPSERDAKDTAVKTRAKSGCTILVAALHGKYVADIGVPRGGARFASFAAHPRARPPQKRKRTQRALALVPGAVLPF